MVIRIWAIGLGFTIYYDDEPDRADEYISCNSEEELHERINKLLNEGAELESIA